MVPTVWNVAEPLEVEYRQPIIQTSDQSDSGRKGIGTHDTQNPDFIIIIREATLRQRGRRSRVAVKEGSLIKWIAFDSTLSRRVV